MGISRIRPMFQSRDFEYHSDIEFQIEAFRTYLKATQNIIEVDVRNEIEKYENIMKTEMEDYLALGFDFNEMEILAHTSYLYYSSIFISISSFLERKMFQLCCIAEKNQVTKIRSMEGTGIYRYHAYLTVVLEIDFQKILAEWNKVVQYARLRNKLVHEPELTETDQVNHPLNLITLQDYLSNVRTILNHLVYEAVILP